MGKRTNLGGAVTVRVVYPVVHNINWKREPTVELCVGECGAACCKAPGRVFLGTVEMRQLKRLGNIKVESAGRGKWLMEFDGACLFLKDDLCSIFENRPMACRRFPPKPTEGCLVWGGE